MAMFAITITASAQNALITSHSDMICHRIPPETKFSDWGTVDASFTIYADSKGIINEVVAYFSNYSTSPKATYFIVYASEQIVEENGLAVYMYCYHSGETGSKTYDKTEYIKIKDQTKETMSSLQLFGYDNVVWAYHLDSFVKYKQ